MSETATPATPGEIPAVPATPVTPAAETVTLTKEQHDQLARDAARAANNQRKADLYDKTIRNKGSHFAPQAPATPPSKEEMDARASEEDRKAERGLLALAADPTLRDVFDADPTLRDLIIRNPLAVLPMYAADAVDAEDALSLVKEALTKLKKPATPPANPATPSTTTPPAPPSGGINPTGDQQTNEAYEKARKNPNTEHALAGMIGAKLKRGK